MSEHPLVGFPMTMARFAEAVQRYCLLTRGSVTSWGRTPKHNRAVGGSATSRHLYWMAMDVVYDLPMVVYDTPLDLPTRIAHAATCGLHLYPEGDHDHLSVIGSDGKF